MFNSLRENVLLTCMSDPPGSNLPKGQRLPSPCLLSLCLAIDARGPAGRFLTSLQVKETREQKSIRESRAHWPTSLRGLAIRISSQNLSHESPVDQIDFSQNQ